MWLHVPSTTSVSAPVPALSTQALDSLCLTLGRSATWREKSRRPAFWRRQLSKAGWLTRLSGLTCSPLTATDGVASWMGLLVVSRASLIPMPVSALENSTQEIFGLPLPEWYSTLRQHGRSLKMSQASFPTFGGSYDPTYRPWATRLRRESSQRRRSARLIFGSASSGWPTVRHQDKDQGEKSAKARLRGATLTTAVLWPTAKAATGDYQMSDGVRYENLSGAVQNWPTAQAYSHQESNQPGQVKLDMAAKKWATPNWHDGRRPGPDLHSTQGRNLSRETASWATPTVKHKDSPAEGNRHTPRLSHQALQTQQDGQPGSPSGRVLNPRFVEMLMGWPSGLTGYESSAMELYPWQQHMRSSLCRLGWELSCDA